MACEEAYILIGVAGINFIGLSAIWFKLGKINQKFHSLPCYNKKEFKSKYCK